MELVPLKATFAPDEAIAIEIDGAAHANVRVFHLERLVTEREVRADDSRVELGPLPIGGYGVEAEHDNGGATTAFDVLADPLARPRYGFVSRYESDRDVAGVVANARELHLNAIQFYDWMYRHAELVPRTDEYEDPLGRRLSLATVRALVRALREAGTLPFAYAAVYAVGRDESPAWKSAGLFHPDGEAWTLGENFLWIVDPSNERWREHFAADLGRASAACGFVGFHLDQYGDPKVARRSDGSIVDMAAAFPRFIDGLRTALPSARLIFNNVNNFPTWSTAGAQQDAVYIEVWPPHTRLDHLARLIRDARALTDKPIILAAYLSVFASADEDAALAAARRVMATIFSHGASHLFAGEDGAVLVDPYYVRHHIAGAATRAVLRRWYDFAVRFGDVLYDPAATDVTTALAGGVNRDVVVEGEVPVSVDPAPGTLWLRVVQTEHALVLHLIDLAAAEHTEWDRATARRAAIRGTRLRIRRIEKQTHPLYVATPEGLSGMTRIEPSASDDYDLYELPEWADWALCLVRR